MGFGKQDLGEGLRFSCGGKVEPLIGPVDVRESKESTGVSLCQSSC